MNIQEATEKALQLNGCITRMFHEDWKNKSVKPINEFQYRMVCDNEKDEKHGSEWNPSADDIAANNWVVYCKAKCWFFEGETKIEPTGLHGR